MLSSTSCWPSDILVTGLASLQATHTHHYDRRQTLPLFSITTAGPWHCSHRNLDCELFMLGKSLCEGTSQWKAHAGAHHLARWLTVDTSEKARHKAAASAPFAATIITKILTWQRCQACGMWRPWRQHCPVVGALPQPGCPSAEGKCVNCLEAEG